MAQLLWGEPADALLHARVKALSPYSSGNLGCLAREMVADPRARLGFKKFYMGWLDLLRKPNEAYVDATLVPEFSANLVEAARLATERFVEHVVFESEGTFWELLMAPYAFSNPTLDVVYRRTSPPGVFTQQHFRGDDRVGLFTQAYFLMTRTTMNAGSPTQRGASVYVSLYCKAPPAAPPGARGTLKVPPNSTTRAAFEVHYANSPCSPCHALQGRPGYSLEHFDMLGRYRTTENGLPVDTATSVPALGDTLFSSSEFSNFQAVNDARGWMEYVRSSGEARQCHAAQWLAYARTLDTEDPNYLGLVTAPDQPTVEYVIGRAHVGEHLDLKELVIAITETAWFLQ